MYIVLMILKKPVMYLITSLVLLDILAFYWQWDIVLIFINYNIDVKHIFFITREEFIYKKKEINFILLNMVSAFHSNWTLKINDFNIWILQFLLEQLFSPYNSLISVLCYIYKALFELIKNNIRSGFKKKEIIHSLQYQSLTNFSYRS